jgi:predicted O-methyltransferase YrrM
MATAKKTTTKTAAKKTVAKKVEPVKDELEGWNSEKEVASFLGELIKLTKAKTVLEVGVFRGNTSIQIINALPKGGYYVGIDIEDLVNQENKQGFINHGKQGKVIELVIGDSINEMPKLQKNHFDLVFIDGNHTFDHVLKEFKLAETLITRTGIIAFHDSLHLEDVKRVVEYAKAFNYNMINLDTPEGRGLALVSR